MAIDSKALKYLRYGTGNPYGLKQNRAGSAEISIRYKRISPELDDANPTCFPAISRTNPYVIFSRDSYFNREVWPNSPGIFIFFLEIFVKFGQKSAGIVGRDSPFRGVLWVLKKQGIDELEAEKNLGQRDLRDNRH
jgi:hypothetical protein